MEKKQTNKNAIISIICSCVGLIIFWWLGIVGIILGARSLKEIKQNNEKGNILAIIAIVIGAIDVILFFVGIGLRAI